MDDPVSQSADSTPLLSADEKRGEEAPVGLPVAMPAAPAHAPATTSSVRRAVGAPEPAPYFTPAAPAYLMTVPGGGVQLSPVKGTESPLFAPPGGAMDAAQMAAFMQQQQAMMMMMQTMALSNQRAAPVTVGNTNVTVQQGGPVKRAEPVATSTIIIDRGDDGCCSPPWCWFFVGLFLLGPLGFFIGSFYMCNERHRCGGIANFVMLMGWGILLYIFLAGVVAL